MKVARELNDFERGDSGASITKTAYLASFSTVSKVTAALYEKDIRVGDRVQKLTFDDCDPYRLVRYVRKDRRATLSQVTGNFNTGRDQQEQFVDNYLERDIIVMSQCMNPLLRRQMHI